jgi:chromosome segregation ATPase
MFVWREIGAGRGNVAQNSIEPLDNLRTALTGAGLGAVLLEVVRRAGDSWQKRQQAQAEQRLSQSKAQADAATALRTYMERQMDDLRGQVQRLRDEADARERRFAQEAASHIRRIEDMERKESRINAAVLEFLAVLTTLMPGMPDLVQRRVQNALERLRQVSGIG